MNIMKKYLIILIFVFSLVLLSGCTKTTTLKEDLTSTNNRYTQSITEPFTYPVTTTTRFWKDYEFTYFEGECEHEISEITDGLTLVKNSLYKKDGNLVIVYALEVNLNKVSIVAGTKDNEIANYNFEKATPYQQAIAYENSTGRDVYASINADFFGSKCVNAFVKDGFIIKNAHTSNGSFDYLDTSSDLPASAPMLFGVKGSQAQIAPIRSYTGDITQSDVKRKVVTSQLSYTLLSFSTVTGNKTINSSASINFTTSPITLTSGSVYAIVDTSKGSRDMKVLEVNEVDSNIKLKAPEKGKGYVYALGVNQSEIDFVKSLYKDDEVSLHVRSASNTWKAYTTIIGCRQSLVVDGSIAPTVTLENTNGAQSKDVPRSAVGVIGNSSVVIFAVESMYYGKKNQESDSHGLSLPELADFMCYYGISEGANFDGGGSTQLIIRDNNEFGKVVVRSSDTGSYNPNESRSVMNTLLVVSKE